MGGPTLIQKSRLSWGVGTLAGLVAANSFLPQPLHILGISVLRGTHQLRPG